MASCEFEGIVSSSIVTLFSVVRTMSGLAVDVDKFVGKVAGGDSLARKPGGRHTVSYSLELSLL